MPINYSDEQNTDPIGDTNLQQATTNQLDQLAIGTFDADVDTSPHRSIALSNNNYETPTIPASAAAAATGHTVASHSSTTTA